MDGFGCCDKKINKLKGKHAKKKSDKERKGKKERRIDGKENDKKGERKKLISVSFEEKKSFQFSVKWVYRIYIK